MATDRTELEKLGIITIAVSALFLPFTLWTYVRGTGSLTEIVWSGWALFFLLSTQFGEQPSEYRRRLLEKTARMVLWLPVKFIVAGFILSAVFYGLKPYLFASV